MTQHDLFAAPPPSFAATTDGPADGTAPPRAFSAAERLDLLRLIRSENVGPVTVRRLLDRFGTARKALEALPALARNGGRAKPVKVCTAAAAEKELMQAEALGARLLCLGESAYPALLAAIDDAPPCLYALGHPALLARPCIGMVGARNASVAGKQFARKLALDLVAAGVTVVSGLARGIDTAAHDGALYAGAQYVGAQAGTAGPAAGTAAVLAGGVDVIYPPENDRLHRQMAEQGVILSEMPPGTIPQARHFPRRNRIISGLSLGVVVVEASAKSGSLITARCAADQGREVFAVPGSPLEARSEGPNLLLRDGATLIRHAGDILEAITRHPPTLAERGRAGFSGPVPALPAEQDLARARAEVVPCLTVTAVTVDEIIRQCQLSFAVVSMILLELELAGRLERHPGNRVSLLSAP